jgi:hypothetical protein
MLEDLAANDVADLEVRHFRTVKRIAAYDQPGSRLCVFIRGRVSYAWGAPS